MSHSIRQSAKTLAMLAVTLLGTACGQAPSATAADAGNGLTISFRTLDEPAKGANEIEAVVEQDGKPVTDATVAVTFRMPAMPNMNMPEMHSTVPLTHERDGRYVGTGQLEMAGSWNVTVAVSRNGAQVGSARFSVQAK
ncbi:MAG TPA: FixH family protein [Gammaproteobacteria bacterium]|nr:FixH family protein [Gammaproteobacteria bacterium]